MTIQINFKAILAFFILLAVLAIAWFVTDAYRHSKYQIIVQKPVSGLIPGAPVEFNGVVVGNVTKISFLKIGSIYVLTTDTSSG